MNMKVVIVRYERVSPVVLDMVVRKAFPRAMCRWVDLGEECFEFYTYAVMDLAMLEDVLAEYL